MKIKPIHETTLNEYLDICNWIQSELDALFIGRFNKWLEPKEIQHHTLIELLPHLLQRVERARVRWESSPFRLKELFYQEYEVLEKQYKDMCDKEYALSSEIDAKQDELKCDIIEWFCNKHLLGVYAELGEYNIINLFNLSHGEPIDNFMWAAQIENCWDRVNNPKE